MIHIIQKRNIICDPITCICVIFLASFVLDSIFDIITHMKHMKTHFSNWRIFICNEKPPSHKITFNCLAVRFIECRTFKRATEKKLKHLMREEEMICEWMRNWYYRWNCLFLEMHWILNNVLTCMPSSIGLMPINIQIDR